MKCATIAFLRSRGWAIVRYEADGKYVVEATRPGWSHWPIADALQLEADADFGSESACALLERPVFGEDDVEHARRRVG